MTDYFRSYGAWWCGERGGGWVKFYEGTEAGAQAAFEKRVQREPDSGYAIRPINNPPWEPLRETADMGK